MAYRGYLFEFTFEKGTQKDYVRKFLKETKTDYFNHYENVYADIFGIGEYYRLEVVHVCEGQFEVYYIKDDTKENTLSRIYPIREKAISVVAPFRTLKLTLEDGSDIRLSVNGCKDDIERHYMGRVYLIDGMHKKVVNIEYLS